MTRFLIKLALLLALAYLLGASLNTPQAQGRPLPTKPVFTAHQHVTLAALGRGYTGKELACLHRIVWLESRYHADSQNKHSTSSGLFGQLKSPSGVIARTLPLDQQVARGLRYIEHRYGNPTTNNPGACNALRFHNTRGWY